MLIDAHTHLQPHGVRPFPPANRARIELYVEAAQAAGLDGIVFTEHLFRFHEALAQLDGWWEGDPDPKLKEFTATYWRDAVNLRLPEYVAEIEAAKSAGLPVFLGLEMDWIPGRADDLRTLLAPFAWDLVLGSVHWVGAFAFDNDNAREGWERCDVERVFAEYAQLVNELAGSGLADVIAHCDVPKLWGHRPNDLPAFHAAIVAAAVRGGCAIEVNTNGWNKPVDELYPASDLLTAARRARIPITLASDAHSPARLGERFADAIAVASTAGYDGYVRFERRQRLFTEFA